MRFFIFFVTLFVSSVCFSDSGLICSGLFGAKDSQLTIEKYFKNGNSPFGLPNRKINKQIDDLLTGDDILRVLAGSEFFPYLEAKDLKAIADDPSVAHRVSSKIVLMIGGDKELKRQGPLMAMRYSSRGFYLIAKIILMRLQMRDGKVFTQEEQAKYFGMPLETIPVAYRFDSRPPETISEQGGFRPNEVMGDRTLPEHSFQYSPGSSQFVSVTLQSKNASLLRGTLEKYLIPADTKVVKKHFGDYERWIEKTYMTYEYEVTNLTGTRPLDLPGFSIPSEKEFVVSNVDLTQVKRYRLVYVVTLKHETKARVIYSDWQ